MTWEIGRDEEPCELGRVSEEGLGVNPNGVGRKVEDDWASWGAEDPAFFIKSAEGE